MTKNKPLVSIIIPTYNSASKINACINSIKSQTYSNIETIVVDQSSSDKTQHIAKAKGAKIIVLPKPDFYSPPTKSRNEGAKVAQGVILYHLDSDMQLSPKLIEETVDIFKSNKSIGALIVHEEDKPKGFWGKCKAMERRCYWGDDRIESARVVRKEIFIKVGCYDENINSGEDFDIHRRYKKVTKIGFCKNLAHHDLGEINFRRTLWKKFNYGKTAQAYFSKHKETGPSLLRTQINCYLKNWRLFLRNPILGFGTIFLKFSEFFAGGLGLTLARSKKGEH